MYSDNKGPKGLILSSRFSISTGSYHPIVTLFEHDTPLQIYRNEIVVVHGCGIEYLKVGSLNGKMMKLKQ